MPTKIDDAEVGRLLADDDALLIEVLPESAYETIHLPGAINIPLEELDARSLQDIDRSRPIVVYCYDYQ